MLRERFFEKRLQARACGALGGGDMPDVGVYPGGQFF